MKNSMEEKLRENLLACLKAFQQGNPKLGQGTISLRAHGSPPFFEKLNKRAAGFTARTYDQVIMWFSDNWPKGTPWPKGVPRIRSEKTQAKKRSAQ